MTLHRGNGPITLSIASPSAGWPKGGREGRVGNGSYKAWPFVAVVLLLRREVRVRVRGAVSPSRSVPPVIAPRAPEEGAEKNESCESLNILGMLVAPVSPLAVPPRLREATRQGGF